MSGKEIKDREDVPMILVGNKIDLADTRVVTTENGITFTLLLLLLSIFVFFTIVICYSGRKLAEKLGMLYIETSAKNKINIEETIIQLLRNTPRKGREYH